MTKLKQRVEKLEGGGPSSVEAAEAARQFTAILISHAERFDMSAVDASDEVQAAWSAAQRVAWRMRFKNEPIEDALVAVGWPMPRDAMQVVMAQIDALDRAL